LIESHHAAFVATKWFKYKFFFSINILSVIKVGFLSEGGDGAIVCSAFECTTFEVDVGAKNVVTKCGDVPNTNLMEKKKNGKLTRFFRMLKASMGGSCAWDRWESEHDQVLCLLID
jgi:hypothetical protein